MNDWCTEINSAKKAFLTAAQLTGEPLRLEELEIQFLPAPHQPSSLPADKMAIYAFWWDGIWLKIGKAGPKSGARYLSQHYTGKAKSTLSGSLANDPRMKNVRGFDERNPGEWIKQSTCRANILIPSDNGKEFLSLLEAFLHLRLKPRYEGGLNSGGRRRYEEIAIDTPFLDKVYQRVDFDRVVVFEFFTVFSLFEYALKRAGYLMNRDDAQADWERFANEIDSQFDPHSALELANAVQYMLNYPVMKQVVQNGGVGFVNRHRPPNTNDTVWLSVLIRGVRNNLFHGGKFRYDRPRDTELIENSLIILEAWSHCHKDIELYLRTV